MWPQRDSPCSGESLYPDTQMFIECCTRCEILRADITSSLSVSLLAIPGAQPDPKNCWRSTMFPAALAKNPTSGPWLHLVLTSYIQVVSKSYWLCRPKFYLNLSSYLVSSCLNLATVISCLGDISNPFTGLQPRPLPSCSPSSSQRGPLETEIGSCHPLH